LGNGLFCDRIGGRTSMVIGAAGTTGTTNVIDKEVFFAAERRLTFRLAQAVDLP